MKIFRNVLPMTMFVMSTQAGAVIYKNPVIDIKQGEKRVGFAFAKMSRDLSSEAIDGTVEAEQTLISGDVTFAVSEDVAVELRFGLDDSKLDEDGAESSDGYLLGVKLRSNIKLDNQDIKMGGFASLQSSTLSNDNSDTDVFVIDLGVGVSKKMEGDFSLYGGGVFSKLDGTLTAFGTSTDFEGDDVIGVFGGIEKKLANQALIGAEINFMHQTGIAAYFEIPF